MALINMHNFCNIAKKECEGSADIRDMDSNKRAIQHQNTHGQSCVSLKWEDCCGAHPCALVYGVCLFALLATSPFDRTKVYLLAETAAKSGFP
tara:strand:- start:56 stop:334 length:279 start_codon:yes stop_codon:yes gene_type:complete